MQYNKFMPFGGPDVQFDNFDLSNIVILPICYENKPSYGIGSLYGPIHILNASFQLEQIDEETLEDWTKLKIHTLFPFVPSSIPDTAVNEIKKTAIKIIEQKKFLLSLGGDHAISIGLIDAANNFHKDISVLQIDAHADLRNTWNGSKYNHACVIRRILDNYNVPVVQVGIRSFSKEELEYIKNKNLTPFYAHLLNPNDNSWMLQVANKLSNNVYITLDLDGLDPSVIPGTGTPEPGGLSYKQVVELIKIIGKEKNVIGADINELSKIEGTQVSEYTAAKLATKIFIHCSKNN
ncbi:MAG: agmatinase [Desulfobacterales bacterium]|nr:agmatinase [Desulfobacterales bacterium]